MMVPAPGLFSIMVLLPRSFAISCASARAITSVPPPGANGTTILMMRSGKAARAGSPANAPMSKPETSKRHQSLRVNIRSIPKNCPNLIDCALPWQRRSGIRIYPLLLLRGVMSQHVDKCPHLRRQVMPMRIHRVHGKLDRTVFRQQAHQPATFEIVMHDEAGREANRDTFKRHGPDRLAAVRDEITGDPHRSRVALAVDEAPLLAIGVIHMAHAVVRGKLGQLLRPSELLQISVRAA